MTRPQTKEPFRPAVGRHSGASADVHEAGSQCRPTADDPLAFYRLLAGFAALGSYRAKFTAVVLAGVGLPLFLIALILVLFVGRLSVTALVVTAVLLGSAGVLGVLWAVDRLLRPLALAEHALDAHAQKEDLPRMDLPGSDSAAQVLRGVQSVIARLRMQEALSRSAGETDELTGLCSRRHGRTKAQALLDAETRRGRTVRVVVADVDGMRDFNARFGMGHGDALLKALGARMASIAGERGMAMRWSGDRFLLLQAVPEQDSAATLAELIGRPLVVKGSGDPVRLSYGETCADKPTPFDALVAEAEARLASRAATA